MSDRRILDRARGANPDIRSTGNDLTFHCPIVGLPDGSCLHLRCDASGDVFVSLSAPERVTARHAA